MHGHGRGTRLGTCLVQLQCVYYIVASAACVITNKYNVFFDFICPKTYARKHRNGVIQNNTLLLQLATNKHAHI